MSTIYLDKKLNNRLSVICKKLTSETGIYITRNRLIYLVCILYERNERMFIEKFSSLIKQVKLSFIRENGNKKYILNIKYILDILKEKNIPLTVFSKNIWGNKTEIYKYIKKERYRINKNQLEKISRLLKVPTEDIAKKYNFLQLNIDNKNDLQ